MKSSIYYHCYNCNNIPSIVIQDDKINIKCSLRHNKTTNIIDFCNKCIKQCQHQCENGILIDKEKLKFCENCNRKFNNFNNEITKQLKYSNLDKDILSYNKSLENFIHEINQLIIQIQKILSNMQYELYLYQSLLTTGRKFIYTESINNLRNLNILKDIDNKKLIVIKKLDEIKNELSNFHNFEYKKKDDLLNNYNVEEKINDNNISKPEKINKSLENKSNIYNNRKEENTYKNYLKKPEKDLYQINGIKLEDIETRNKFIVNKLINMSVNLEEIDIKERNKFLENIKYISDEAIRFSGELADLLKKEFQNNYPNLKIDDSEKMKRVLSSWFNQSLIIDESKNNKRPFFDYFSKIEINRIKNYTQINSNLKNIFSKNSYDFEKLFSDLLQLNTETIFYSEKKIIPKKVDNCNFANYKMKDITDINGKKIVKYTVLPGLVDDKDIISKIIVFCEKYGNKINKHINHKMIYNCNITYELDKNEENIIIKVDVVPKIKEKGIRYKLEFGGQTSIKFKPASENTFIIGKEFKNKIAICTVLKNIEILCSSKIKLEINDKPIEKKNAKKK